MPNLTDLLIIPVHACIGINSVTGEIMCWCWWLQFGI